MGVPGSANPMLLAGGAAAYQIDQSLRFENSDHLYWTPSSAPSGTKWTISFWFKWGNPDGSTPPHWPVLLSTDNQFSEIYFTSSAATSYPNGLAFSTGTLPQILSVAGTPRRDVSAWYHVVWAWDTTQSVSANRSRYWINNREIPLSEQLYNGAQPSQNASSNTMGSTYIRRLGTRNGTQGSFSGYLAEFVQTDGTVYDPTDFGEYDEISGAWRPKEISGITFGTRGYYLKFDPAATNGIGHDHSGNGNNWTASGFTTSGTGTDVMSDTPTTNWCTLNPLDTHAVAALTDGNLAITGQSASKNGLGTIAVNNGKWYYEAQYTTAPSTNSGIGVATIGTWSNMSDMDSTPSGIRYRDNGVIYQNGASQGTFASYTTNDIIGVAFDCDTGQISFYKNNTLQTTLTGVTALQNNSITACLYNYAGNMAVNFGQRAFAYTPPTGFKALNTANLPEPTIKKGGEYFNTVLYTGNGGTQTISGVGFQPDFVWIKDRSSAFSHRLVDAVRGSTEVLFSDSTAATQVDSYGTVDSFTSDGFALRLGTNVVSADGANRNGDAHVAWNWKESATAGFDIVTFTATSTSMTVNHSLGVTPDLIILKKRNSADDWGVNSSAFSTRTGNYLLLNSTQAIASSATTFTGFSSTTVSFGSGFMTNTATYVAYLFSEVAGYSKFGSYTGNGSTDGPFVFCGFRPRWLLVKRSSGIANWYLVDSVRSTYNVIDKALIPDLSNEEETYSNAVDLLSNGFKPRTTGAAFNASGSTYIFAAFSETAFKYSNAR